MARTSIRSGVFETNSSSMHSLTLCSDSDYEKWKRGELLYDWREGKLITPEMRDKKVKEEIQYIEKTKATRGEDLFYEIIKNSSSLEAGGSAHIFYTYEEFQSGEEIYDTTFEDSFTTESGEVVHAFGYHGRT